MARVPSVYSPQIRVPVVDAVRVPVDQTGAVIANAAERISAAYETKQKQDASVFVAQEASAMRLRYLQRLREDSANGRVGDNYTGGVLDGLESERDEVRGRAPNRFAQEAWDMAFIELQGDIANNASGMEVQANLARRVAGVSDTINTTAAQLNMPGSTPDQVVKAQKVIEAAVLGAGIPADKRDEIIISAKRQIADAYYRGLAEEDPERAIKEITTGTAAQIGADAGSLSIYRNQAEAKINQREAKKEAEKNDKKRELAGRVANARVALQNGADPSLLPEDIRADQLMSAGMPELADEILRSQWVGNLVRSAAVMTPAELQKASETPDQWAKDITKAAVSADDVQAARAVIKSTLEARKKDPAGQAMLSPAFQEASAQWQKALEAKAPQETLLKAEAGMVSALIEAQRKNGTPDVYIRAFTNQDAGIKAAEWQRASGVQKLRQLSEWKRQFGSHNFKYVKASLAGQLGNQPDLEALLMLNPDDPDAEIIANSYDVSRAALNAKIGKSGQDSIARAIAGNTTLNNHYASAHRNGANLKNRVAVESMIQRAAAYMIGDGGFEGNATGAVERVVRTLLKKNAYVSAGNGVLRIPATLQSSGQLIADGALSAQKSAASKAIPWDKIDIPLGGKRENFIADVRSDGYFVSDSQTTGAQLLTKEGRPITVNGKPFIIPWEVLRLEGAARTQAIRKPAMQRTEEENKRLQGDLFGGR